jgi:hypothetical protein
MRRHNAERFGSILMALALAVFHVDVWGAGPRLHVIPNAVALTIAAFASSGLAWLALREREQALFNIGFGGALLAPFVTSTVLGVEAAWRLLGYGLIVLTGLRDSRKPGESTPSLAWQLGVLGGRRR